MDSESSGKVRGGEEPGALKADGSNPQPCLVQDQDPGLPVWGSLGCVAIRNSSPWVLARLGLVLAQRSKLTRLLLVFFLVALRYGMLRKPGKCLVIKHLEFFFKREHV